jgi:hypothetical protein
MTVVSHNVRRTEASKQLSPSGDYYQALRTRERELTTHTVKELRAMAKDAGLTGYIKLRKADLVTELARRA